MNLLIPILVIISAIISATGGSVLGKTLSSWQIDKDNKWKATKLIFSLVIIGIGSTLSYYSVQLSSKISSQHLITELNKIQSQNDQLQNGLAVTKKELSDNNHELVKKSEKIAELNDFILSSVTGGENHGKLFTSLPNKNNFIDIMFVNNGKYPLYDVTINMEDKEKLVENLEKLSANPNSFSSAKEFFNLTQKGSIQFNIGNVGPSQVILLGGLTIPDTDKRTFNIRIMARNGTIHSSVKYQRFNGGWKMAVQESIGGKIVHEDIDPEFTKDKNGKMEW